MNSAVPPRASDAADPVFAVVGATGAVGREALSILASRGVPLSNVRAIASRRSAGVSLPYAGRALRVAPLEAHDVFAGVDVALFCADAQTALRWAPVARDAGVAVVDNSSAFRARPDVPLIIPEINGPWLIPTDPHAPPPLIANPNCSTIILLLALEPLRRAFGLERIHVVTYQAVSGAGLAAIDELREQTAAELQGRTHAPVVFREPCAFNVFSHDSPVDPDTGLNGEEAKIIAESRKIWNDPTLALSPACARVPVVRAHTQAITVVLRRPATEPQVRAAYGHAPGVIVVDDRLANAFPTPRKAAGRDEILVGRLRPDPGTPIEGSGATCGWSLMASGDQLRKGAALNAVQIAEALLAALTSDA